MKVFSEKNIVKLIKSLLLIVFLILPLYPVSAGNECRQHCAFPGECGGYIDDNHNELCDHGESNPTLTPTPAPIVSSVRNTGVVTFQSIKATPGQTAKVCSKHCGFPGKCRNYIDKNRNQLCDSGETAQTPSPTLPVATASLIKATQAVRATSADSKSHHRNVWNTCRHQKHCAFPGECGGYVDTDGNNLCDRGEPAPTPTTTPLVSGAATATNKQKKML